ncbi:M20/M25/M40 family metallo-hydrolase [Mailhella massiliensis]|uniref:M20/M25/M40 family metallo-hydrolase n=1 Tax=Mailhella massiliensis TaxID=1903261 RepID=A0A921AUE9_9BACT|nr:M20/M25/M40 family metallo-hydrolase [Mailhella massiliensis]HJD96567.1 M20/M25/M40 family metallo-hydrolase [Mailhella massiliensis]
MEYLDAREAEMFQLLKNLVEMETPSADKAAVSRLAAHLDTYCDAMGMTCEKEHYAHAGDALFARTAPGAQKPVALLAHLDTVHPAGSWPVLFRQDGDFLYGPGVYDCKGGIVIALFAVRALMAGGYRKRQIRLVLSSDEETAHMLSEGQGGQLFTRACEGCAAAFNCESGSPCNEIVTERMGGAVMRIHVTGIAAHAGRNPEKGASAIRTAARLVERIEQLTDFSGNLFNCGKITGGTGANVIADSCDISLGLRYHSNAGYEKALRELGALCEELPLPGTSATLSLLGRYPAMEKTPGTDRLLALYGEASHLLGLGPVTPLSVGGCSDSAFITQMGIPTLCSLGIAGANAHTKEEYALRSSMLPQCRKLVTTILSLPDDGK